MLFPFKVFLVPSLDYIIYLTWPFVDPSTSLALDDRVGRCVYVCGGNDPSNMALIKYVAKVDPWKKNQHRPQHFE